MWVHDRKYRYQRFRCKNCGHPFILQSHAPHDASSFRAKVTFEYLLNRSLRKVKASKAVGRIGKDTILATVIAVALSLPEISALNRRLSIHWSGRYLLDAVFFDVRGESRALLILADAQSLDLVDYAIAEAENYDTWHAFIDRVKPEIETHGPASRFFVSDGKKGLHQALSELFPHVPRQLCLAHKQRRINQILPQIRGDVLDWAFGHLAHQAVRALNERGYFVYYNLLLQFLKPSFFDRLSPAHQHKLRQAIGALRFQRMQLHARFKYPDLIKNDTTTNILEGINGFFKERLRLMRGLKADTHVAPMIKLLVYYYRFHVFTASSYKHRNGKRPIELNHTINHPLLHEILKGRAPYDWIKSLISPT